MDTDRNLLFAVLALQAGLLGQDRFVQGCALWTTRKHVPLGDLLVQQGWLTVADRSDLDRLLDRQLRKHAGDAQASLAAAAGPEAKSALASLHDADVDHSLARLSAAPSSVATGLHEPDSSATVERAPTAAAAGRNQLFDEIGRGGMGAVFKGRDTDLGRELAVKVLLEEHRGRPELVQRFFEEAQIAGQLQHPGVPPVYELGRLADGQPFFTMKLVKGHTLAKLLKQRADPGAELGRFLAIFEQVCQTIAYAHSHGVIHRDLKPSNVMVGAFGEVQVMDWGLAKVLERRERQPPEQEPATHIQTRRSGSTADGAQTGIAGTPGYVAPEQARGEPVDERADVFSLGAMLCEMLTGRPAYSGAGKEALWGRAQRADLGEALARLDGCGSDRALIALAKRCLSGERDDRPRHAGEVAREVAAYLAGVEERARRAEQERVAAEARADEAKATTQAERRARRLGAGLAAAALLLLLAGAAVAWVVQRQHAAAAARQREADLRARDRMDQARELLSAGWQAHDFARLNDARALADQAAEIATGGSETTRGQVEQLQGEVRARLVDAEKNRSLLAALLDVTGPRETRTYARDEGGMMVAIALPSADEQFGAAFHRWGLDPGAPVAEVVTRLQSQPAPVVQEVVAGLDEWALHRRRQKGRPEADWRRLLAAADQLDTNESRRETRRLLAGAPLKRPAASAPNWEKARAKLLRRAEKIDVSTEPVLGLLSLARVLEAFGEERTAEKLLRSAVAVHRGEAVLLHALGALFERQRPPRLAEAVECYRAACAVRPQLGVALAQALTKANRAAEGEAVLHDLARRQSDNPDVHFYLGYALSEQKRPAEAEKAFRRAIQLRPDFAEAHHNLGVALSDLKRHAEAEKAFRRAIALRPDLAEAHTSLGVTLRDQNRPAEAVKAHRRAIALKPDYAEAHYNLGNALRAQKSPAEAEKAYRRAIDLQPDLPEAHIGLGNALRDLKRPAAAERAFRRAIEIKPDLALAHYNLGVALLDQKRPAEAEQSYRRAIQLRPDLPEAHHNLGGVLLGLKRPTEAEKALRRAIQLRPNSPEPHIGLGNALRDLKRPAEAEKALRRAIQLGPDLPEAHYNLGIVLLDQKRPAEAEKAHRRAIQFRPDDALAHNNLGDALLDQKKLDEAVKAYRRADELQPNTPIFQNDLRRAERLLALDRRLTACLEGKARPAGPQERLLLANHCGYFRERPRTALRLSLEAFREAPKLADDLKGQYRYNATCFAALAAAGKGHDAVKLADEEHALWRRQALTWLRADLALWRKQLQSRWPGTAASARQALAFWQADADLASIRDPEAVARFPEAERDACRRLWADVAALLQKQAGKP
jgi:serine/threonine-protein kinase